MSLLTDRNSCVLQHEEEPSSEESRAACSSPDLFHHDTHSINNPTSPSHYSRCSLIFWKPVPNFVSISVTFQKPVAISASQLYVKGMLWWQVYSEISPVSRLQLSAHLLKLCQTKRKVFAHFIMHKITSLSLVSTHRANNDLWQGCIFAH